MPRWWRGVSASVRGVGVCTQAAAPASRGMTTSHNGDGGGVRSTAVLLDQLLRGGQTARRVGAAAGEPHEPAPDTESPVGTNARLLKLAVLPLALACAKVGGDGGPGTASG